MDDAPRRAAPRRDLEQQRRQCADEAARRRTLGFLCERRQRDRAERDRSRYPYGLLRHLREGGWGRKDMQRSSDDMKKLANGGGTYEYMPNKIAQRATEYYTHLFEPTDATDEKEADRESALEAPLCSMSAHASRVAPSQLLGVECLCRSRSFCYSSLAFAPPRLVGYGGWPTLGRASGAWRRRPRGEGGQQRPYCRPMSPWLSARSGSRPRLRRAAPAPGRPADRPAAA